MKTAALIALFSFTSVSAHGVLTQVSANGKTACAVHTGGCTPTDNLFMREIIARTGNTGECANPPGCEANFNCDHCGLEKVKTGPALNSNWWTSLPATNWDLDISKPVFPCMSKDSFGRRGTMGVSAGDSLNTKIYVNADHSGLYQFQLMCGEDATNAALDANPITPWKSLHKNKEGVELGLSRVVGYTRTETDNFFKATTCTGARCDYRMNRNIQPADSNYCKSNPADCFVEDVVTIPSDFSCSGGKAILRWLWNSAEGPEIYANCLDLSIGGSGEAGSPTPQDSGSTPSPPPTTIKNTGKCFEGESCIDDPNCCPVGEGCYEKDQYWASCKPECTPGIDPNDPPQYQTDWTCELLGGEPGKEPAPGPESVASSPKLDLAIALAAAVGFVVAH